MAQCFRNSALRRRLAGSEPKGVRDGADEEEPANDSERGGPALNATG